MRYAVAGLVALSLVALLVLGSTGTLAQRELGEHWYRYGPYIDKITSQ